MDGLWCYKLFSLHRGDLYPLFINTSVPLVMGEWLLAEDHPTKGYAHRPGWHCTDKPEAPHIKKVAKGKRQRVWARVEIDNYEILQRPASQGGTWYLAEWLKIHEVIG